MDGWALPWLRAPLPVATLLIAGREWLWPALGCLILILGVLAWSYRRAAGPTGLRVACFLLKLLGLLALAACLLEPLWVGQRAKPGANYFAVLVDNSRDLLKFEVKSITGGTDALGEVLVSLEEDGITVRGQGADTDIIVAAAMAYINALNKLAIRTRQAAFA